MALGGRPARTAPQWAARGQRTGRGHRPGASITQPGVKVARIETVTMTSAEYASAVEALAGLIARSWENQGGTKAA